MAGSWLEQSANGTSPWMETPVDGTPNPPAKQGGLGGLGGFVGNLYQDLYNRNAAPDEVSFWANSGKDPSQILDAFTNSQEFKQTSLPVLYQNYLGRAPDQQGLNYWLNSGLNLDQIASALGTSQESKGYLTEMPDPSETSAWEMQGPDMPTWLKPFDFGSAQTPIDQTLKWYSDLLSKNAAAGAGANFATESWFNPTQPQTNTGTPDGTPYLDKNGNFLGFGLSQLGGYRLNGPDPNNKSMGLMDFAKRFNMDPNATETQLRHQYYEMQDGWLKNQNLINKLRNAKTPIEAMGIFGGPLGYERPADKVIPGTQNWTERARNAEILNQYMNGGLDGLAPDQRQRLMDWQARSMGAQAPAQTPTPPAIPTPTPRPSDAELFGTGDQSNLTVPQGAFDGLRGVVDPAGAAFTGYTATPATMTSLNYNGGSEYGFIPITPGGLYSSGVSPTTNPFANPFFNGGTSQSDGTYSPPFGNFMNPDTIYIPY